MIRLVLDTNIWVSAFLAPDGHCGQLVRRLFLDPEVEIVMSATLLDELVDVLSRPRLARRYGYGLDEVKEYAARLWTRAEQVLPRAGPFGCRDTEDDVVCGTAVAGRATYVVTRDDDLKRDPKLMAALTGFGVEILSVSQISERLPAT